jgi:hypothetical protein
MIIVMDLILVKVLEVFLWLEGMGERTWVETENLDTCK